MKNNLLIYLLIFLFVISCSADNLSEGEDIGTISSIEISSNDFDSNTINDNLIELDAKYRTDGSFVLPTFNGNCPHSRQSIIDLFNYWNKEFEINLTYNIGG